MSETITDHRPHRPAPAGAARPGGRAAARLRSTARALPWILFAGVLLLPVGGFLLVAFSPGCSGRAAPGSP
ncbi:hypothetical protein GXW82_07330 [Streptacidiphilus sp. 4-A2]|nr:hypothetical protein [Streptacidiphilus sp. 4-A2]